IILNYPRREGEKIAWQRRKYSTSENEIEPASLAENFQQSWSALIQTLQSLKPTQPSQIQDSLEPPNSPCRPLS
ncbi:hypothetical protein TNCV_3001401, partial [Trichonephila clavipes]